MSGHRDLALAALGALQIRSPTSYTWCGDTHAPLAGEVERAMSPQMAREFLLYQLQHELYVNFYCRGFPMASGAPERHTPLGSSAFVETLARFNHGRGTLQPGWTLREESASELVVQRDGLSLWVASTQAVAGEQSGTVSLRLPCELRKASPGFYLALGETAISEADGKRLLRLYWHLTSPAAPKLLDRLTGVLNRAKIPFQLKVIDNPDRYRRCDAGVLYVPRTAYGAIAPDLREAHRLLAGELRSSTPAFTKRIAPGLGLAEDPGDGQSFGMHRALLLARSALLAHEQGCETALDRGAILSEVFGEEGLDLDRPYLSPSSSDDYEPARP